MSKKVVSIVVLVVLLLTLAATAFAVEPFIDSSRAIGEMKVSASVSISNGNAKATGSASMVPSGYTAKITVELQKKSGGSWVKVTGSSGGRSACASSKATSGVSYRAHVTCKLYDSTGAFVDSISKDSGSKTY